MTNSMQRGFRWAIGSSSAHGPFRGAPRFRGPAFVLLITVAVAGCEEDQPTSNAVSEQDSNAADQQAESVPATLAEISFAHPALRERVERMDRLVREMQFPSDPESDWHRNLPHEATGRRHHSYSARWSSVRGAAGQSIQPGQEPATTVWLHCRPSPKESDEMAYVTLTAMSKTTAPGWNAQILLATSRPYLSDSVGKDKLSYDLRHTDGVGVISPPFPGYVEAFPGRPVHPEEGDLLTVLTSTGELATMDQCRTLAASPESFREEALRELAAAERRVQDDIAASRGVERGSYTQVDFTGRMKFRGTPLPKGETLTSEEKAVFRMKATVHFAELRDRIEQDYREMHASILRAFPIDKYLAEESDDGPH